MANKKSSPSNSVGGQLRVSALVVEDWETACLRVQSLPTAQRLWDRVLTVEERHRLGGNLTSAYKSCGGTAGMWMRLRGVSFARAVVEVATQCEHLTSASGNYLLLALGETADDPDEAIELAKSAGGLVLTESPREAWWKGNRIEIDWMAHDRPWQLLWEFARQTKSDGVVDSISFEVSATVAQDYLKKLKGHLIALDGFPGSLSKVIKSAGRRTYRLTIAADKIRVFARGAGESLREWLP